ncbi:Imm26 family immunity protein [Burkholderia lata]|uniref:Imm26 family immunity protein n=1 Tax=Burkholderia lata (strain ATCC 17760 / DSM 23089 / LMG 22485 / NCIMB 9086 / R18194 / 383) TaxID=482957 RepID=UPI0015840477|nr:Imm26 family immunity protein [Burkholderia lata]
MNVAYKEGDVFIIELSDGRFAVCQIVFSSQGKFKKAFAFCVLSIQDGRDFNLARIDDFPPMAFRKFKKEVRVIFSGIKLIAKGEWPIIGNSDLSDDKLKMKIFNYAGGLFNGDEEIGRIPVSDYSKYTTMEVSGFDLVQKILTER